MKAPVLENAMLREECIRIEELLEDVRRAERMLRLAAPAGTEDEVSRCQMRLLAARGRLRAYCIPGVWMPPEELTR